MIADDWTVADAYDAPVDALTADGRVRVTGAVWADDTERLEDVIRRAGDLRRLFGDAAEGVGDL
ncbi:hypothetical protein G6010_05360 [Dietzia sp. SLG510A3-3B2-2]|nr:hypothetical protein [Dietzia sp. SLG510A3-40A3]MBB1009023.1 hypothetical protein [Dietzia sp. SLG510A3-3B2-2]